MVTTVAGTWRPKDEAREQPSLRGIWLCSPGDAIGNRFQRRPWLAHAGLFRRTGYVHVS